MRGAPAGRWQWRRRPGRPGRGPPNQLYGIATAAATRTGSKFGRSQRLSRPLDGAVLSFHFRQVFLNHSIAATRSAAQPGHGTMRNPAYSRSLILGRPAVQPSSLFDKFDNTKLRGKKNDHATHSRLLSPGTPAR
jgi:hypothetical protein